jgi:predicted ABC-type exoprotein transport system permease subunit
VPDAAVYGPPSRYGNYKGPLAVAPLFLKHNRRIEALITVICLALLVFCLIERHIRQQSSRSPHRCSSICWNSSALTR